MPLSIQTQGTEITAEVEHRSGICENCHIKLEKFDTGESDDLGAIIVLQCPQCKGRKGSLFYQSKTIREPVLPEQPIAPDKLGLKAAMGYIRQVAKWRTECNELINTYNAIQEYEELREKAVKAEVAK